ncbi:esterase OVCA2 [Alosa sapidissima]|uniref:esterase OVCA2 n=1 Tax=Alosa sapidissima TaxID=34773 RepID=UPI001C08A5E3|nr:esterase OVCA2 [Alosa sapidissima]
MSANTALRVLCLHGYRQNAVSFREKTGALRKLLKNRVELVYITAPLEVPSQLDNAQGCGQAGEVTAEALRGWWFSDGQQRSFHAGQECEESEGLEASVEVVRAAVREQGPFDGVLGFSQGAALVAMLLALQESGQEPELCFHFAIIISGFRSACAQHARFYSTPVATPTLHVFGEVDAVIPIQMSRDLLAVFEEPDVLTHSGGHFVPAASAHKSVYLNFIQRFQKQT